MFSKAIIIKVFSVAAVLAASLLPRCTTNEKAANEKAANEKNVSATTAQHNSPTFANLVVRDIDGKTKQLSDLYKQRPLVLVVYLGAGCPMCVMNLKQLSQRAERIRSYGWHIAALSNDTPADNREALTQRSAVISDSSFIQPGGDFEIPLYSDSNHVAMETLGCYRRVLDTERHGIFLITTQGAVRFSAIDRRPFEDYEALMDSIRALNVAANLASEAGK